MRVPIALVLAVALGTALGACAAAPPAPPAGPTVWVLPAPGRDLARFRREDGACRRHALEEIGPEGAGGGGAVGTTRAWAFFLQRRYDLAYAQCMAASGNRVPLAAEGAPFRLSAPYASYTLPPYHYGGPPPYAYCGPCPEPEASPARRISRPRAGGQPAFPGRSTPPHGG